MVHGLPDRRRFLVSTGLGALGLSLAGLRRLRARPASAPALERRRANRCVFIFLFGGPSHIDLWDMKPDAPAEVRGEFRPSATRVPGIQVCEHLPRLGQVMDKVCLLRSMTHRMNVHGPACSEMFSGRPYFRPPTTDQASREDWPSLGSLVTRFGEAQRGLPSSVVLPWYVQFPGQPRRIAGQTGGRMNERYNSLLLQGDPSAAEFELEGLRCADDLDIGRLRRRQRLVERLETRTAVNPAVEAFDRNNERAFDLLGNQTGDVLDLRRETEAMRDSYGRTPVGASLLLARRLVEAGVSLVTVNWQDETKIDGVNTCWDTHQDNFPKLRNLLCPIFDRAFPAFVGDLHQRGLLESTLVVAVGEFGRTPRLGEFTQSNNTRRTGRDHWPHAFTALLAGGGVRGGQVYGATTSNGGYVRDNPVTPADLSATILHHLGIDYRLEYEDEFQRVRNRLSDGQAVEDLG
ncbi:MAG: DUF1501 domain-containing protein [Gemmataceae bacterium]